MIAPVLDRPGTHGGRQTTRTALVSSMLDDGIAMPSSESWLDQIVSRGVSGYVFPKMQTLG